MIIEREKELEILESALKKVRFGHGQLVIICGEAGIGKTSLIEHFIHSQQESLRFLRGACDPFSIPHPLCPLIDIARQIPDEELSQMLWKPSRPNIFHACLEKIQSATQPTVVVFEDIHWADEATYDLMIFLGRRIRETNCLMIVTYRNDALSLDHPVRNVIGRLSGQYSERLNLACLSKDIVVSLANEASISGEELFQLTDGNPFYVTEFLENSTHDLPHSVSESIVARFIQRPPAVRKILEFAAIIPKRTCNYWLLEAVWNVPLEVFEQCAASGLVDVETNGLVFRHALMRQAIAESLPFIRRKMLHMLAIEGLVKSHKQGINIGFTHIVYHAEIINDIPTILQYAPMAAQEAINLGAHQQAANHYRMMLDHLDSMDMLGRANIYQALAYECYLTGQLDEACQNGEVALQTWRQHLQGANEANSLSQLSRFHWFLGNNGVAETYAEQALAIAKKLPGSIELARAYSNRSQLHMLKSENAQAIAYGEKALELAERLQSYAVMSHALNNIGTAEWASGDAQGVSTLIKSLQLAKEHHLEEHVARANTNITSLAVRNRQYEFASPYFAAGLEYCERQGLDSWDLYMRGWLARCYFEQGQWQDAQDEVKKILEVEGAPAAIRQPALLTKAYIAVRQGDVHSHEALSDAWFVAQEMHEIARLIPTVAIRAEAAWFNGALHNMIDELSDYFRMAMEHKDKWDIGILAFWLWKAGKLDRIPELIAQPYLFQITGEWQSAADSWKELKCPYEQAVALLHGDSRAQKEALEIFESLRAEPAAHHLRKKLRDDGIYGPHRETRANPAGLTKRQMQVLELLVQAMTDAEIAESLTISTKTAGHHVSAILSKLEVRTRHEAVNYAVKQKWLSPQSLENRDKTMLT